MFYDLSQKDSYKMLDAFITPYVNKYENLRAFHVLDAKEEAKLPLDKHSGLPMELKDTGKREKEKDYLVKL